MIRPSPGNAIDRATRLDIKEFLLSRESFWCGAKSEPAFLSDLYPLDELPSKDPRYKTAYEDIHKHREMNNDGDDSWVFDDERLALMSSPDETFLKFVAHTLHPRVRKDSTRQANMLKQLNMLLAESGYELYETTSAAGSVKFSHRSTSMASDIEPIDAHASRAPIDLIMVGEGSYAHVYSYVDPNYEVKFAVKKAKKSMEPRELTRFKQEFECLQNLDSPHVVKVYRYDDSRDEYTMEFCDQSLKDFIKRRNNQLTFDERKRIALQFLRGLKHIHDKGYLHRDLSHGNVLVKLYEGEEVLVKISDLGLVKDSKSDFTRTGTEMRGTHLDPQLEHFRDFGPKNEVYAIGYVLQYIFTGRASLSSAPKDPEELRRIIQKCTDNDLSQRYETVVDVIADVEGMEDRAAVTA